MNTFFEKHEKKFYLFYLLILLVAFYLADKKAAESFDFNTMNFYLSRRKYGAALDLINEKLSKKKSFEGYLASSAIYLDMGLHREKKTFSHRYDQIADGLSYQLDYGTYGRYNAQQLYALADEAAENALAINDKDAQPHSVLAVIALRQGAVQRSEESMVSAMSNINDAEQEAKCLVWIAYMYYLTLKDTFDKSQYDQAIVYIKRAVRADDLNAKAHEVYADLLMLYVHSSEITHEEYQKFKKIAQEEYQKAIERAKPGSLVAPAMYKTKRSTIILELVSLSDAAELKRKLYMAR
ncbi:MAG: hypothetical protein PHV55_02885 [Candidatus Omnitrophica bacterium]|nr:hypothetical protein [Candidatus Omnitrophota bacterium]